MEDKVYYIIRMLVYRETEAREAKTLKMKCLLLQSCYTCLSSIGVP